MSDGPMKAERLSAFDVAMLLEDGPAAMRNVLARARRTRTEARGLADFLTGRLGEWPPGRRWERARLDIEGVIADMTSIEAALVAALAEEAG